MTAAPNLAGTATIQASATNVPPNPWTASTPMPPVAAPGVSPIGTPVQSLVVTDPVVSYSAGTAPIGPTITTIGPKPPGYVIANSYGMNAPGVFLWVATDGSTAWFGDASQNQVSYTPSSQDMTLLKIYGLQVAGLNA